jgi:hypothetical protein
MSAARKALALAVGASDLMLNVVPLGPGALRAQDLVAARELLTMAILLLDSPDPAREKKNARDRARRAKAKAKPAPRPRPKRRGSPGAELRPDLIE